MEKVSEVHIKKGTFSFIKGYIEYLFNKENEEDKNVMVCLKGCFSYIKLFIFIAVYMFFSYILEGFLLTHTELYEVKNLSDPKRYVNPNNGDYCVEDATGKTKCVVYMHSVVRLFLAALMILAVLIFLVLLMTVIMGLLYDPIKNAFNAISSCIQALPKSIKNYNEYRKKVDSDIKEGLAEIV